METIGNRLRTARESQGLSIEDAAHRTRIQPIYIRGLENDDFSNFPSTTYAKSFLTLYSRFLEVDAGDAIEMFAGGDAISLSGQGYLEAVTDNIEPRRPNSPYATRSSRPSAARRSQAASPGLAPLFLGVILLALVIAIPTFWILGKDSDSMDEVVSKAEDLTNTNFTTSDPQAEKVDPKPAAKPEEEAPQSGPAAPAIPPVAEPEPARISQTPKETKVAQVIPPSSSGRTLETAPGGAAPVVAGKKAQETKAQPLRAVPAVEAPAKSKGSEAAPESTPSSSARPLRAVPLIARPVIEPEATEPSETEGIAELRENGNRYPRPSTE